MLNEMLKDTVDVAKHVVEMCESLLQEFEEDDQLNGYAAALAAAQVAQLGGLLGLLASVKGDDLPEKAVRLRDVSTPMLRLMNGAASEAVNVGMWLRDNIGIDVEVTRGDGERLFIPGKEDEEGEPEEERGQEPTPSHHSREAMRKTEDLMKRMSN